MRTALEDGQIPKDIFNDQLALGKRPQTHPQLRYKDICERDMKALDINTEIWEDTAANRNSWRCLLKTLLKTGEEKILILNLAERGEPGRRHTDLANPPPPPPHKQLRLHFVQQRLPLPHWSYQTPTMLF